MRSMFADFLVEAATVTRKESLRACAERYRELAAEWTGVAETALPDSLAPMKKTKALLRQRQSVWRHQGARGHQAYLAATAQLVQLERRQLRKLALSRPALLDLLRDLQARIENLHAGETVALQQLVRVVG